VLLERTAHEARNESLKKSGVCTSHARHLQIAQSASGAHTYCYRRGPDGLTPDFLTLSLHGLSVANGDFTAGCELS
jgi:hypothetical protein